MTALLMVAMLVAGIFLGVLLKATFAIAAFSRAQEQRRRAAVRREIRSYAAARRNGAGRPGLDD